MPEQLHTHQSVAEKYLHACQEAGYWISRGEFRKTIPPSTVSNYFNSVKELRRAASDIYKQETGKDLVFKTPHGKCPTS